MKKRTHHRRATGLHPFEKAMIRRDWRADSVSAQIHALAGDDAALMVNKAGRIFYVLLGAAVLDGIAADDANMRVLRGAVNALHEQAGEPLIDATRRQSIQAGLDAAERLTPTVKPESIFAAACELTVRLRNTSGVVLADFERLVAA